MGSPLYSRHKYILYESLLISSFVSLLTNNNDDIYLCRNAAILKHFSRGFQLFFKA